MIDRGAKIRVEDVAGWYDAGQVGTLLETNRTMLEHGRARRPAQLGEGATVVEPVYIEDGVTVTRSTVGPNVSLSAGAVVEDSELRDTIVGAKARVEGCRLRGSLVGDRAWLRGVAGVVNVGDDSEVQAEG